MHQMVGSICAPMMKVVQSKVIIIVDRRRSSHKFCIGWQIGAQLESFN